MISSDPMSKSTDAAVAARLVQVMDLLINDCATLEIELSGFVHDSNLTRHVGAIEALQALDRMNQTMRDARSALLWTVENQENAAGTFEDIAKHMCLERVRRVILGQPAESDTSLGDVQML